MLVKSLADYSFLESLFLTGGPLRIFHGPFDKSNCMTLGRLDECLL